MSFDHENEANMFEHFIMQKNQTSTPDIARLTLQNLLIHHSIRKLYLLIPKIKMQDRIQIAQILSKQPKPKIHLTKRSLKIKDERLADILRHVQFLQPKSHKMIFIHYYLYLACWPQYY